MKKVVFLGLGYIGLPTAAVAAAHGFEVIGVDVNPSVVETINQGKIHIVEPELGQVVRDVVQSGKLRAVCKPEAGCFLYRSAYPIQAEPSGGHHLCGSGHPFRDPLSAGG